MNRHTIHRTTLIATALLCTSAAQAYTTFEGDPRWGSGPLGTGAVITWSLMPEGTAAVRSPDSPPFLFQEFWAGSNDLASVYAQLDADPALGETIFLNALTASFATWSAAAHLSFVQVSDDGSPIGFVGATDGKVGDIRIGAYKFLTPFSAFAGHAFEPPGGTSSLAAYWGSTDQRSDFGDVNLNTEAVYSSFAGLAEGDAFPRFGNDIQGLLSHEIGHALGLGHPEADGLAPGENQTIMYVGPDCCSRLRRTLGADDVAGVQYLYGAVASVPEPSAWLLMAGGLWPLSLWAQGRQRQHRRPAATPREAAPKA